jgi:hypothetical protein
MKQTLINSTRYSRADLMPCSHRSVWRTILLSVVMCCAACRGPVSSAQIIEQYSAAECIAFSKKPTVSPHTREWNTPLTLSDGSKVVVSGTQSPGGRISVYYPNSHRKVVAADAGDYVYPSDVRLNTQNDLLYVKATGLAGGLREETWLFAYDLLAQHLVARQEVTKYTLPPECKENSRQTGP